MYAGESGLSLSEELAVRFRSAGSGALLSSDQESAVVMESVMDSQELPQPPLETRQEAFRQLVERQDGGTPVLQSRNEIGAAFSLSPDQVAAIEREGLSNSWPPLS